MREVIKLNIINSLGSSFFQNFGLIGVLIILVAEWYQQKLIKNEKAVSMLAMIYFVFFAVNTLTYFALTNVQNFLAILVRLSSVFKMEEYNRERDTSVSREDVIVEMKNCSYSWGFRVLEN